MLVAVYNVLPQYIVDSPSVQSFQKQLQDLVRYLAVTGYDEWKNCLNRSSLSRTVLPRVTENAVRQNGELLPPLRVRSE